MDITRDGTGLGFRHLLPLLIVGGVALLLFLGWRAGKEVYDTVRPHQSLGYRTPKQFLHELALLST